MRVLPEFNPSENMPPPKLYYLYRVFLFSGFLWPEQQLISSLVYRHKFCALRMTKNKLMSADLITIGIHYNGGKKNKANLQSEAL